MEVGSKYTLEGFVEFEPDNFDNYKVTVDYADASGTVLDSTSSNVKDIARTSDGKLLLVDHDYNPNIATIYVTIFDEEGNQVYYDAFMDL